MALSNPDDHTISVALGTMAVVALATQMIRLVYSRTQDPLRFIPTLPWSILDPIELWRAKREGYDAMRRLRDIGLDPEYNRVCVSRGWDGVTVIVSDPALIKELLVKGEANYNTGNTVQRSKFRNEVSAMMCGGFHVGNTMDSDWRWRRRALVPLFQPRRLVPAALPCVIQYVNKTADLLQTYVESQEAVELDGIFLELTLDIINKYIFGLSNKELDFSEVGGVRNFSHVFDNLVTGIVSLWPRLPLIGATDWARSGFTRYRAPIVNFLSKSLDTTLSRPDLRVDDLSASPRFRPVAAELACQYGPMSDPENHHCLVLELMALVFAGQDTTSHTAAFALGELATRPDLQEKCAAEARSVFGKGTVNPTEVTIEQLSGLVFISAVLKETQRLYPVGTGVSAEAKEDIVLGGYRIPAGVPIRCNFRGGNVNPDIYPDPLTFNPSRWLVSNSSAFEELGAASDSAKDCCSTSQLPELGFSFGAHACLGRNLALLELRAAIALILSRFELKLKEGTDIRTKTHFTMMPMGGVWVTVKERK